MLYETQRINSNLVQLLTLYKLGQDRYPFSCDEHHLGDFTQELVAQNKHLLDSRQVQLEVECPTDLYWPFDRDLVAGVINHAFNNAIHYTRDRIRLTVSTQDDTLAIGLEDNGRGFPQHMLDDGVAAMRGVDFTTGSTGLGLYFSAVIAKLHRNRDRCGDIELANGGPLGGGRFVLRLP
jgi:signal transduction histidine kinase